MPAVALETDPLHRRAALSLSCEAVPAFTAHDIYRYGDAVSRIPARNPLTQFHDLPGRFMTQDAGQMAEGHSPRPQVQVSAAQAACPDANQHLAGTGAWDRAIHHFKGATVPRNHHCSHRRTHH
jgi:hypothetical protein